MQTNNQPRRRTHGFVVRLHVGSTVGELHERETVRLGPLGVRLRRAQVLKADAFVHLRKRRGEKERRGEKRTRRLFRLLLAACSTTTTITAVLGVHQAQYMRVETFQKMFMDAAQYTRASGQPAATVEHNHRQRQVGDERTGRNQSSKYTQR